MGPTIVRARPVVIVLVAALLPWAAPVALAEETASVTLFLHSVDGPGMFMDVLDTPGDRDGVGPTHAAATGPLFADGTLPLLDFSYDYDATGELPRQPVAEGGLVEATIFVHARVKSGATDPVAETQENVGLLTLRLELGTRDGRVLGSGVASRLFAGEAGWFPFEYAFAIHGAAEPEDLVANLVPEQSLVQSWGYGYEGDHASRLVVPLDDPSTLTAWIAVDGPAYEDAPVGLSAQVEGGSPPYSFAWEIGASATAQGEAVSHVFAQPGLHDVRLAVTDAEGRVARASAAIRVHQTDFVHGPRVVVAVIDSGVNPYHAAFARPGARLPLDELRDADTGLAPREVALTFGEDYAASRAADAATWQGLAPRELVRFAGTNLLGISIDGERPVSGFLGVKDPTGTPPVLDVDGHGTATAGTVVAGHPDALVVAVQVASLVDSTSISEAYRWAARQPWIDVVSMSLGNHANAPASPTAYGLPAAQRAAWLAGKILVGSAGNDPSPLVTDPMDGAPWVVSATGSQRGGEAREVLASSYYPDVAGNYTVVAPLNGSVHGTTRIGGTSFSAPTVAATLAAALHALRAQAGWTGGIAEGLLVPPLGIDNGRLRDAMNLTARLPTGWSGYTVGLTYNGDVVVLPLVGFAEVGWGHLDPSLAPALAAAASSGAAVPPPPHPKGIAAPHMLASHAVRAAFWNDATVLAGEAVDGLT